MDDSNTPRRRKLLLVNGGTLSQAVVMTAAVRDLHHFYPGRYLTDVYSADPAIWENNTYITSLAWHVEPISGPRDSLNENETAIPGHDLKIVKDEPDLEVIVCRQAGDYASSITQSNRGSYHALHSYVHEICGKTGGDYEISEFRGDIHISSQEQSWISQVEEAGVADSFWLICTGGQHDIATRRWQTERYQQVIDTLKGKVTFVQVGRAEDNHPQLKNVLNLVGKTSLRQLIRLVYHSVGVLTPSSLLMHLAAAIPMRPFDNKGRQRPRNRQCVVIAGGREPWQWISYPHHQVIHTNGMMPCCAQGGCWRRQVKPQNDLEGPDDDACLNPVKSGFNSYTAGCLNLITPEMVVNRILISYEGGVLFFNEPPNKEHR